MTGKLKIELARRIYGYFSRKVLKSKKIRHFEPSIIYSKEDVRESRFLVKLVLDAVGLAYETFLSLPKKGLPDEVYMNILPGEHYRLLNALARVSGATKIVEIGTGTGKGSLALSEGITGLELITFDLISWQHFPKESHLNDEIMKARGIRQIIGDLSREDFFVSQKSILDDSDIIFLDAPKDGVFEYALAKNLAKLKSRESRILIFDDIHLVQMIDFWRAISSPKLDVTSFGHWSGTGLVDISEGLICYT